MASRSHRRSPAKAPARIDSASPAEQATGVDRAPFRVGGPALFGLTVVLLALSAGLIFPFLSAVTWSTSLAVVSWPMHRRIRAALDRPKLAAFLSTTVVVLLLLLPSVFVVLQATRELATSASSLQADDAKTWQSMLNETPIVRNVMPWLDRIGIDLDNEGRNLIRNLGQAAMSLAQGSLVAAIQTLVTVFLLYCLFHDRAIFVRGLRALLPLSHAEEDKVFEHAIDSIYGNLFATLVTSVIDCATGGLLFYIVGVPSPFLWTAVMFVLSLMPILGAGMVWVPMIVSLALGGKWAAALAIAVWGATTFTLVDNLLFARLTGDRMRMHPALALVGFLGGVVLFGAAGMILGPVILAVTIAVLDIWKRRAQKAAPA